MSKINLDLFWFKTSNLVPKRLFQYPSSITVPIFWTDPSNLDENIKSVFTDMYTFLSNNYLTDNKIVLECELKGFTGDVNGYKTATQPVIYMGWKDGNLCLGLGARNWSDTKPKDISMLNI